MKATAAWCAAAVLLVCSQAADAQSTAANTCAFEALQGFMPDIEGSVFRVAPGLIAVEAEDTRFLQIDISCLKDKDARIAALARVGDRVKVGALVVNPEKLVANSFEVLEDAKAHADGGPASAASTDAKQSAIAGQNDEVAAIRRKAAELLDQLPDFLCREQVTRLARAGNERKYDVLDRLSMEVLFSRAKGESYRSLLVNGVPTPAQYARLYGNISTGEFGSMIRSLFGSLDDSAFHREGDDKPEEQGAREYSYTVSREKSDWRIESGYQFILPGYTGSIVVDGNNALVKVTRTADVIPSGFPYSFVESSIEYGNVEIQGAGGYHVPVRAQMDSCDRVTRECMRNVITFDSFLRFTGTSKLILIH